MTIAVAEALCGLSPGAEDKAVRDAVVKSMQDWGNRYPWAGYGARFIGWLGQSDPQPYGSYGNGSAMRASSVGWLYDNLEETRRMAMYCRLFIHEWEKECINPDILDGEQWGLEIKLTGSREIEYYGSNAFPPYWKELKSAFRPFFIEAGISF